MYELSTIELCGDLANKVLDDEIPRISKGFNINKNQYAINKPNQNNQEVNNGNEGEDKNNNNILPKINTGNPNNQNNEQKNEINNTTEENKEEIKDDEKEEQ